MIISRKEFILHAIKKEIRERKLVTCIDIENLLSQYGIPSGDLEWRHPQNRSAICWTGFSEEGLEMMNELVRDKHIRLCKASALTYLYQGEVLDLHSQKHVREANDIWYPVCFRAACPAALAGL